MNLLFTLTYRVKDNKIKIEMTNFIIQELISGKSSGFVSWSSYSNIASSYSKIRPSEVRDYQVEQFFEHEYKRAESRRAFQQFQEIVDNTFKEAEAVILDKQKQNNW